MTSDRIRSRGTRLCALAVATMLLEPGCGSPPPAARPTARLPGAPIATSAEPARPPAADAEPGAAKTAAVEATEPAPAPTLMLDNAGAALTLADALALALAHSPRLAAYSFALRASEASALQAGLFPNPEFEGEVEDFGGSGDFSGFDEAESTISLSQLVELGGKRAKRLRLAESGSTLAEWDYEAARLAVLTETTRSFVAVLAGVERLGLARRSLALAEEVLLAAGERVAAGKTPPLEETRARVVVAKSRLAVERATRELAEARVRLGSAWGRAQPGFDTVVGDLRAAPPVPPFADVAHLVEENPDIARWVAEVTARHARVDVEEAQAIPDVRVRGGVRLLGGSDDTAFVVGLSLPLPFFDRNQGRIRAAQFDLSRAEEDRRAAEVRVRADLATAYERLLLAHAAATALRDEVVPGAESAFESARVALVEGKVGYLEVLDAERTLNEVRGEYVDALEAFHGAKAEVEGLLGRPLPTLETPATGGTVQ